MDNKSKSNYYTSLSEVFLDIVAGVKTNPLVCIFVFITFVLFAIDQSIH